jgi:hypothetical protein
MRTFYFDLDGTLLVESFGAVKPALARGAFERAVRAVRFDRLVCVGNAVTIAHTLRKLGREVDGREMIRDLCRDAIVDTEWFLSTLDLASNPEHRVCDIDFDGDWWYADDLAELYFARENLDVAFTEHNGERICITDPEGDGSDLLTWLAGIRPGPFMDTTSS